MYKWVTDVHRRHDCMWGRVLQAVSILDVVSCSLDAPDLEDLSFGEEKRQGTWERESVYSSKWWYFDLARGGTSTSCVIANSGTQVRASSDMCKSLSFRIIPRKYNLLFSTNPFTDLFLEANEYPAAFDSEDESAPNSFPSIRSSWRAARSTDLT
jgi:hypothetical protein